MVHLLTSSSFALVALLAEGVDRNKRFMGENDTGPCRPPRGGRG